MSFRLPPLFATLATALSLGGNIYCQTISFPENQVYGGVRGGAIMAGVFGYRLTDYVVVDNSCTSYRVIQQEWGYDYTRDNKTVIVQTMAVVVPLLGITVVLLSCLGPYYYQQQQQHSTSEQGFRLFWRWQGAMYMILAILQGLTLLVMKSSLCLDNPLMQYMAFTELQIQQQQQQQQILEEPAPSFVTDCQSSSGHGLNITSTVLFAAASLGVFMVSPVPFQQQQQLSTSTSAVVQFMTQPAADDDDDDDANDDDNDNSIVIDESSRNNTTEDQQPQ